MRRRAAVSHPQDDMQDSDMGSDSADRPIGSDRGSQSGSPIPPLSSLSHSLADADF